MGWTYQEYESQPQFFLEEISIFLTQESLSTRDGMKKIRSEKTPIKGYSRM